MISKAKYDKLVKLLDRFDKVNKSAGFPILSDYSNKVYSPLNDAEYITLTEQINASILKAIDSIE